MKDGGCVFRKHSSFKYGHELMTTSEEESNMFATWFRTLSIAYISQVLPGIEIFQKANSTGKIALVISFGN